MQLIQILPGKSWTRHSRGVFHVGYGLALLRGTFVCIPEELRKSPMRRSSDADDAIAFAGFGFRGVSVYIS